MSLKGWNPKRYAPLFDPGDQYSYDIFSQGAQAVRHPRGISPLGNLKIKHLFADGQSQSAAELDDYVSSGADAAARLFNGFLVDADAHHALLSRYRVPTIDVWGEESAQPVAKTTSHNDVIWEVTGMGHIDYWSLEQLEAYAARTILGRPLETRIQEQAAELAAGAYGQQGLNTSATCAGDGQFPRRYVLDAALTDLETWAATGRPPPSAPPLKFNGLGQIINAVPPGGPVPLLPTENVNLTGLALSPFTLVRSDDGMAVGGLRLPFITVPVASYNGDECVLLGTSVPFSATKLKDLYPTHADYVAKMVVATRTSVQERYMTERDGIDLLSRVCASGIPGFSATATDPEPAICRRLETVFASPAHGSG